MNQHSSSCSSRIAVVIPAYRVRRHVADVVRGAIAHADRVYVVDDACPEHSGDLVEELFGSEVTVLRHTKNRGVGDATMTGMLQALEDGADIIAKCDADGQHPPDLLPALTSPIRMGHADYCKGNRFYFPQNLKAMPASRLAGNAALSFLTKASSGYWDIFDPTNGFIAIHAEILRLIPADRLSSRFFFESDMLFRLNLVRARIMELPMPTIYRDESSNLQPMKEILPFMKRHVVNTFKRVLYSYFLRNFSMGSIFLILGMFSTLTGILLAAFTWTTYRGLAQGAPTGEVILPAMLFITGVQFLLGFFSIDVTSMPKSAVHPLIKSLSCREKE